MGSEEESKHTFSNIPIYDAVPINCLQSGWKGTTHKMIVTLKMAHARKNLKQIQTKHLMAVNDHFNTLYVEHGVMYFKYD